MDDLANEIKRKIRIRKFAMDSMGCDIEPDSSDINNLDNATNKLQKLYSQLYQNIEEADQSKIQDGYSSIISKRKIGKLIVFMKKAIRKIINIFLGWYIKPILERQTFYNGKSVNSVNLLRQIVLLQEQNYTKKIEELEKKIACLGNNNSIDKLVNEFSKKIDKLDNILDNNEQINTSLHEMEKKMRYIFNVMNISCDISLLQKDNIDYFKFENSFRGSRNSIKEIQSAYVPYFKVNGGGVILDIGCGRGEFLELMWDNGITAYGIDSYEPFVNYCSERGFNVKMGDALTHLNSLADCSLGGIFMSQVIEHLSADYIRALIIMAYKKLKPGCYFILETPNPDCLAAISEFNIDMSHNKPVHYKALEFLFKEANYTSIEQYHTEQTIYPVNAKHINSENIKNIDEFNQGIDQINKLLFGYRDYTLIAKK